MPTYVVECVHPQNGRHYLMLVECGHHSHAAEFASRSGHIASTMRPMSLTAYTRRNHRKHPPSPDGYILWEDPQPKPMTLGKTVLIVAGSILAIWITIVTFLRLAFG